MQRQLTLAQPYSISTASRILYFCLVDKNGTSPAQHGTFHLPLAQIRAGLCSMRGMTYFVRFLSGGGFFCGLRGEKNENNMN